MIKIIFLFHIQVCFLCIRAHWASLILRVSIERYFTFADLFFKMYSSEERYDEKFILGIFSGTENYLT